MTSKPTTYHGDDYAVWPDGTCATLSDVWRGEYSHMSDDYEIVDPDNIKRLHELGIETD